MGINGERLKALRESRGITPQQMADYLNISRPAYLKYESGKTNLPRKLENIADYFGVSTEYLLGRTIPATLGERTAAFREIKNISQPELAAAIGVDIMTMSKMERGKILIDDKKQKAIASALGVSLEELKATPKPIGKPVTQIPIYGRIVAGKPQEAVEDIIGYTSIAETQNPEEMFALKVFGASMEPTISDGDVIIVHRQPTVDSGQIAVLLIENENATVKRVFLDPQGITIRADNPAVFPTTYYSTKEINSLPVICLGRVVSMQREL